MNINFTIQVHTFEKAAKIEAILKSEDIRYYADTDAKTSIRATKSINHNKFPRLTLAKMDQIVEDLKESPNLSFVVLGEKHNVHQQTVSKIARGVHPMQKKDKPIDKPADISKPEKKTAAPKTATRKVSVLRRKPITKSELAAVVNAINKKEKFGNIEIGKICGVSHQTVGRIRSGTHRLQINGSAS